MRAGSTVVARYLCIVWIAGSVLSGCNSGGSNDAPPSSASPPPVVSSPTGTPVNHAPTLTRVVPDLVVARNQVTMFDLTAYVTDDHDSPRTLTWTVSGLDPAVASTVIDRQGLLTVTPMPEHVGMSTMTVSVTDTQGATVTQDLRLLVAVEAARDVTADDLVQMAADPVHRQILVAHTQLPPGTQSCVVWLETLTPSQRLSSSQVGACYRSAYGGSPGPVTLAVQPGTGMPAVAYLTSESALAFAQRTAQGWDQSPVSTYCTSPSLGFDPAGGAPVMACNSWGDYNLYVATRPKGVWQVDLVTYADADEESLRFDPLTGRRAISFQTLGWTNHPSQLYYLSFDAVNQFYQSTLVDGDPAYVGTGNSLAFDAAGHPHITYFDTTNGTLKHAWQTGTAWQTEVIDAKARGNSTSLAIAPDGRVLVSYVVTDEKKRELRLATLRPQGWQVTTLVSVAGTRSLSGFGTVYDMSISSALVLDAQAQPYMAFLTEGKVWILAVTGL